MENHLVIPYSTSTVLSIHSAITPVGAIRSMATLFQPMDHRWLSHERNRSESWAPLFHGIIRFWCYRGSGAPPLPLDAPAFWSLPNKLPWPHCIARNWQLKLDSRQVSWILCPVSVQLLVPPLRLIQTFARLPSPDPSKSDVWWLRPLPSQTWRRCLWSWAARAHWWFSMMPMWTKQPISLTTPYSPITGKIAVPEAEHSCKREFTIVSQ